MSRQNCLIDENTAKCIPNENGVYNDEKECFLNCRTDNDWARAPPTKFNCDKNKPPGYKCVVDPAGKYKNRGSCQRDCDRVVLPKIKDIETIINESMIERAKTIMMEHKDEKYFNDYRYCWALAFEVILKHIPDVCFMSRFYFTKDGFFLNPDLFVGLFDKYIKYKLLEILNTIKKIGIDNWYKPGVLPEDPTWLAVHDNITTLKKGIENKEPDLAEFWMIETTDERKLLYVYRQMTQEYRTQLKPNVREYDEIINTFQKILFCNMINVTEVQAILDGYINSRRIMTFYQYKKCEIYQWLTMTYQTYLQKGLEYNLTRCKIIVIPIGLIFSATGGHANTLIIRNIAGVKEIIRIEPHGQLETYNGIGIDATIEVRLLYKLIENGYKYVGNFLTGYGIQHYESQFGYCEKPVLAVEGLCQIWAPYVTLVLLLNMNVSGTDIKKYLMFEHISSAKKVQLFQNKAIATFLLMSWALMRETKSIKKGKHEEVSSVSFVHIVNPCVQGLKRFQKYETFKALEPIYLEIDKVMGGQIGGGYYRKYLKYKKKYLQLKGQIDAI